MEFAIDCRACTRRQSANCEDCVVTFVTSRQPNEAIVVDVAELAALRRLASAGMLPPREAARFRRSEPTADGERRPHPASGPSAQQALGPDQQAGAARWRNVG